MYAYIICTLDKHTNKYFLIKLKVWKFWFQLKLDSYDLLNFIKET